jgi:hypothetical protein
VSAADNPLGFVTLDGEPEAAPFESIPAELREQDRWVVWRWERDPERPDEPRKPPYRADAPDQLASSTKPETWASFEQAAARSVGRADGIGFALGPPYVGIDLDEELPEQEHGAIMLALDSYSERSPSGRGHHVIVKASLNGRGRHAAGIGVFQDARFFYCTGQRVQGTPATIEERQEQLELVLAEYLKPEPRRQLVNGVDQFVPLDLGDHELLERAIAASNGIATRATGRLASASTAPTPKTPRARARARRRSLSFAWPLARMRWRRLRSGRPSLCWRSSAGWRARRTSRSSRRLTTCAARGSGSTTSSRRAG